MASTRPTEIASWSRPADLTPSRVGGKAVGLFDLPEGWTPPFFVAKPGESHRSAVERLLRHTAREPGACGIIVRSNAASEHAADARGAYASLRAPPDAGEVQAAIDRVLAQATQPGDSMFAIVQVEIAPMSRGHLSNERHVTHRKDRWVLDEEGARHLTPVRAFASRKGSAEALPAPNRKEMFAALRGVADHLTGLDRIHCEWVWDGRRVWVVQRDVATELRGGPLHAYIASSARPPRPGADPDTTLIRRLDSDETFGWSKLQRPSIFDALSMRTAPVWHLGGKDYVADTSKGLATVRRDLERLVEIGPIVIRCDVRADRGLPDLSLETSDPTTDVDTALAFMRETASGRFGSIDPHQWAFLPAPLVQARVSIMAQARPGSQRVRLHSLWGFPDGIGLLGHDKWSCDMATGNTEERRAYKASCCMYVPGQGWTFERVPAPHDWGHTIDEIEARAASSWARRLADHLGREVQLMLLARIDGRRGADGMLAWHYTDHQVPRTGEGVTAAPSTGLLEISTPDQLENADLKGCRGLLLRPRAGFHRDREFLIDVGRCSAAADIPVYFEGSVLGHPYYLIKSEGATVVPVGPGEPEGIRIEYNKLVRDGVPEIVRTGGGSARVVKATAQAATWLLRQKLIEEAFEVSGASGEQVVEELADLVETMRALAAHDGVDMTAIEEARLRKRATRGGFDQLFYLEATSSDTPVESDTREVPSLFSTDTAGGSVPAPGGALASPVRTEDLSGQRIVLRVPTVPPLRNGIPMREYLFELGDGTIKFRHNGPELEITIETAEPVRNPGQLSLPVDPT